jgi:hypothetical protein
MIRIFLKLFIAGLLSHENTDIAVATVNLLQGTIISKMNIPENRIIYKMRTTGPHCKAEGDTVLDDYHKWVCLLIRQSSMIDYQLCQQKKTSDSHLVPITVPNTDCGGQTDVCRFPLVSLLPLIKELVP